MSRSTSLASWSPFAPAPAFPCRSWAEVSGLSRYGTVYSSGKARERAPREAIMLVKDYYSEEGHGPHELIRDLLTEEVD
jgi:hypothetical protein